MRPLRRQPAPRASTSITSRRSATRAAATIPIRCAPPRSSPRAGGDGITAHLREDRRHIRDDDLARIQAATDLPLNLEMAATDEMLEIALRHKPHAACIVPERREERTTEGGLDAAGQHNRLAPIVARLTDAGIRVSLFIAPDPRQIEAALRLGAPVVELHTGEYAHAEGERVAVELRRIADMAALAAKNGIEPHAGHGLTYDNVQPIAAIPQLAELNIGHYLIGEAIFVGLEASVRRMRELMDARHDEDAARDDHRHRLRPLQHRADPGVARPLRRALREARASPTIERAKAARRPFTRAGTYAKRFAAKEAFSKAVGTGFKAGVFMKDIGVVNMPSGAPTLALTGGAAARLAALTPEGHEAVVHLTLTDDHPWAQAFVVIEARPL